MGPLLLLLLAGESPCQYMTLLSRYANARDMKETYSDVPFYEGRYHHTYYSSSVTIAGLGKTATWSSSLRYATPDYSREDAARLAYQTLTAPLDQQGTVGGGERTGN